MRKIYPLKQGNLPPGVSLTLVKNCCFKVTEINIAKKLQGKSS